MTSSNVEKIFFGPVIDEVNKDVQEMEKKESVEGEALKGSSFHEDHDEENMEKTTVMEAFTSEGNSGKKMFQLNLFVYQSLDFRFIIRPRCTVSSSSEIWIVLWQC